MGRSQAATANEAWEALFRAQATLMRDLGSGEAWGELQPSEYGVLYALSQQPEGLRMSDLSKDVLLSQAGLSRLVGRLETRGLIQRQADPQDARASILRLSPAGTRLQRRVGALHGRHIVRLLTARLDNAQLGALRDLCAQLVASPQPDQGGRQ